MSNIAGLVSGDFLGKFQCVVQKSTDLVSWSDVPYIYPTQLTQCSCTTGEMATGTFRLMLGNIKREDTYAFATETIPELENKFVRVQVVHSGETWTLWRGYFPDMCFAPDGSGDLSGEMIFTAYGLEFLLTRYKCYFSYCIPDERVSNVASRIDYVPQFNGCKRGHSDLWQASGNMSPHTVNAFGTGAFHLFETEDDCTAWTGTASTDMILRCYCSASPIGFVVTGLTSALDNMTVDCCIDGMTAYEAMCSVINKTRGMVWTVLHNDNVNAQIRVNSVLSSPISVGGYTIPQNNQKISMTFDGALDVDEVRLVFTTQKRYRNIIARGERVKSIFTATVGGVATQSVLEPGWDSADETTYKNVTSAETDTVLIRQDKDEQRTRASRTWGKVYKAFKLSSGYAGITDGYSVMPQPLPDGTLDFATVVWPYNRGQGFMRSLPFAYAAGDVGYEESTRPFAIIYDDYGHGSKYRFTHDMGKSGVSNMTLMMGDNSMQVLFPNAGHLMAKNHWTFPADTPVTVPPTYDTQNISQIVPWFDYLTLKITLGIELDVRPYVQLACSPNGFDGDLVIDVPNCCVHCINPSTVVDLTSAGVPVLAGGTGYLRDDSDQLWQTALFAQAWYGEQRALCSYRFVGLYTHLDIGMMVMNAYYGQAVSEINTVVTKKIYTIPGPNESPTCRVSTGYYEVDVLGTIGSFSGGGGSGGGSSSDTGVSHTPTITSAIRRQRFEQEASRRTEDQTRAIPVHAAGSGMQPMATSSARHRHNGTDNLPLKVSETKMVTSTDTNQALLGLHYNTTDQRWYSDKAKLA